MSLPVCRYHLVPSFSMINDRDPIRWLDQTYLERLSLCHVHIFICRSPNPAICWDSRLFGSLGSFPAITKLPTVDSGYGCNAYSFTKNGFVANKLHPPENRITRKTNLNSNTICEWNSLKRRWLLFPHALLYSPHSSVSLLQAPMPPFFIFGRMGVNDIIIEFHGGAWMCECAISAMKLFMRLL